MGIAVGIACAIRDVIVITIVRVTAITEGMIAATQIAVMATALAIMTALAITTAAIRIINARYLKSLFPTGKARQKGRLL